MLHAPEVESCLVCAALIELDVTWMQTESLQRTGISADLFGSLLQHDEHQYATREELREYDENMLVRPV